MKRILITIAFTVFVHSIVRSQATKFSYVQFDFAVSVTGNQDRYNSYDGSESTSSNAFFVPNGLGSQFGYGIHYKKWATLGVHSGVDWKWDDKAVAVPVFLNLGLSPKVGTETRIMLQVGYGKGFAIGRGNLNGEYKKLKLGIGSDDFILFAEIHDYAFPLHNQKSLGAISFGITLQDFFYYKSETN
ncbi:hypothetical protein [Flavobacterium foetidum]|uniref:hypothetical protein n=1 Tax=Flavobacterium foetidum TaxID=2026681 RepID=UPI0010757A58|nr:hypothetical protein [Flavobacterium foetidum]KAF2512538.1 hypothetical protein E0W73_15455 [Flavobacterium foetidum]